jgi:ankyrin repeat protein
MKEGRRAKRPSRVRLAVLIGILLVLIAIYLPLRRDRLARALTRAVLTRDSEEVRRLLESGADPNARAYSLRPTPGAHTLQEWLVSLFHPRPTPGKGKPLLLLVVRDSDGDLALDMLAHGADANSSDDTGVTALMYAASSNDVACLNALLAHGARIHARD